MLEPNIDLEGGTILLTGIAGFIGASLAEALMASHRNMEIVGVDSVNDYYDVLLKRHRLARLRKIAKETGAKLEIVVGNIADKGLVDRLFDERRPRIVVNLAAQAGVRYSIDNPGAYIESNIIGFYNILEGCRRTEPLHLVYASSSSVYGGNTKVPFSVEDNVDHPVSLYAATKKSNELLAYAYSKLYNIPSTGLRFFTVYGPAGRPDMAYFSFANKLRAGERIQIYNWGKSSRDFTYIDDIVKGVALVMERAPERRDGEDGLPVAPHRLYNIGNSHPENLAGFVRILAGELVAAGVLPEGFDLESRCDYVPMQKGDVPTTYADASALERDTGFRPETPLRQGLARFAAWYKAYYNI